VLVSPGRDRGEGRAGLEREQAIDFRPSCGRELGLGDLGDQALAFGAPGAGVERKERRCTGQEGGDKAVGRREPGSPGSWPWEGRGQSIF